MGEGHIFLRNYTTDNGTAECAAGYAFEIEEWSIVIRQVDRASVTTGQHNGVGVWLKGWQPELVHTQCAAHRVALAMKNAKEGVQSVAENSLCLQQIFKTYKA